ncbi:MAG TPA: hypothetical protein VM686_13610 [Polyangiaceae bacterium]|nr:hypothetical protein [Polyangiaceae bacterium]
MVRRGSFLGCLLLLACSPETEKVSQDEVTTDPNAVTYYEDVAPILYENCVGCHRPGTITPFSLTDYASAKEHGIEIVVHTADRHKPPMPVDNSGACNTYSNARWLTETELQTLADWVDQGSLEGNPLAAPALPEPPAGLTAPSATLDPGFEYLPNAALADDYRCFVLPAPVQQDAYVTAYEVVPGDPRVVHHVIIYQPSDDVDVVDAEALDAAEPGEGYTCFGGPGVSSDPLVLWAPGGGVVRQPEGTGVLLAGHRKLVMQVHYNLDGGSFPDRSRVLLELQSSVATLAKYQPVADTKMQLAPGLPMVETQSTFETDPFPVTVYGVMPHMHTLGRTLRVDVDADNTSTCLVSVDRWSFHWQNAWWYTTPLSFRRVDAASIRCGFDTSTRDETVTWGEGTMDEMCLSYLYISSP